MIDYIRNIVYIAFRSYVQPSGWWYTEYVKHYRSIIFLQLYTILACSATMYYRPRVSPADHVYQHSANWTYVRMLYMQVLRM